ncbi:MAG: hypothetical protein IJM91_03810 [Lachnospiraceae bacterium]|nr:hypothetical protein [Lachnospiraceae bacterium]
MIVLVALAIVIGFNYICESEICFIIPQCIMAVITAIYIGKKAKEEKSERQRVNEAFDYLEQVSFAFMRSGKIDAALRETYLLFKDGRMKEALALTLDKLKTHVADDDKSKIFTELEETYPINHVNKLHSYMLDAEKYGGHTRRAIFILKREQYRSKERILLYIENVRLKRKSVVMSCFAGMIVSLVMIAFAPERQALTGNSIFKFSVLLYVIALCAIAIYAYKKTVGNYLIERRIYSDDELLKKLKKYYHKEKFIGRRTLYKILSNEIRYAFTEWILSVALLLETHNVEGAIRESASKAPVLLKPYISTFLKTLKKSPQDPSAYIDFLDEFAFPEVTSSMRLLYSLSIGTLDNIEDAIDHILEQNDLYILTVKKELEDKKMAGLSLLFMMPVVVTSFKLIADMSVILLFFVSSL